MALATWRQVVFAMTAAVATKWRWRGNLQISWKTVHEILNIWQYPNILNFPFHSTAFSIVFHFFLSAPLQKYLQSHFSK